MFDSIYWLGKWASSDIYSERNLQWHVIQIQNKEKIIVVSLKYLLNDLATPRVSFSTIVALNSGVEDAMFSA